MFLAFVSPCASWSSRAGAQHERRSHRQVRRAHRPLKATLRDDGEDDAMLEEIRIMRQKMKEKKAREAQDSGAVERGAKAAGASVQDVISNVLLYNFFAVIFFLGWLIVGVTLQFGFKNSVLLDPWLQIWPNVIQPVLGVLMLGTILSGTASMLKN